MLSASHHHKLQIQDAQAEIGVGPLFIDDDPWPVGVRLLKLDGHIIRQIYALRLKSALRITSKDFGEFFVDPDHRQRLAQYIGQPLAHILTRAKRHRFVDKPDGCRR